MHIGSRVYGTIAAVLALALGLTVYLNHGHFKRIYQNLVEARYLFLIKDIRAGIENALDLHLPLEALSGIEETMQRTLDEDETILAIIVYDTKNQAKLVANRIETSLSSTPLQTEVIREHVISTNLYNDFGSAAGKIVLLYDIGAPEAILASITRQIALRAFVLAVGVTIIAMSVIYFMLLGRRKSIARMIQAAHYLSSNQNIPFNRLQSSQTVEFLCLRTIRQGRSLVMALTEAETLLGLHHPPSPPQL